MRLALSVEDLVLGGAAAADHRSFWNGEKRERNFFSRFITGDMYCMISFEKAKFYPVKQESLG